MFPYRLVLICWPGENLHRWYLVASVGVDIQKTQPYIFPIVGLRFNARYKNWEPQLVMLITKSNKSFFSNQRNVPLRLMIWFGQFRIHSRFYPYSAYLQVSGISNQNLTNYSNDKAKQRLFCNQGDLTLRLMIQFSQFSNSSMILSMSTLSASFR